MNSKREEPVDTTDLPPELVAQLVLPGRKRNQKTRTSKYRPIILRLLKEHQTLTVNKLLIEMHKSCGKVMTRGAMFQHLNKLQQKNLVKRELTGVYALSDRGIELLQRATRGQNNGN